jgi:hypothetical protein
VCRAKVVPSSDSESVANLLIARRECAAEVVRLVENVDPRDSQPRGDLLRQFARFHEQRKSRWNVSESDQWA